ncbi:MAG: PAS domain S-box protein [Acidimicrobiia bacterium]|nr:PAS domain S-box protein [Acidimicrobiia bacterium]
MATSSDTNANPGDDRGLQRIGVDPVEVIESSPDGIVITDADGTILLMNRCAEAMFGYPRSELIGRPIEILVPNHLRGPHAAHRTRYRVEPQSRPMGSGLELRGRRRDGSNFPVEISLSPIGAGDDLAFFAAVRDVGRRIEAEAESDAIRHVVDSAHDALYMFEPDSLRLDYANRGLVNQLGYDRDELLTMTPLHFMPDVSRAALIAQLQPLVADEVESVRLTTTHRTRRGADIPVDVVINYPRPARSDQNRRLVALARDVSRRHEIEQERDDGMRWLEALARIRSMLLSEPTLEGALTLIADQIRSLTGADVVIVAEPAIGVEGGGIDTNPAVVVPRFQSVSTEQRSLVDWLMARRFDVDEVVGNVLRGGIVIASRTATPGRLDIWNQAIVEPFDQVMLLSLERLGTVHGLLLAGRIGPEPFTEAQVAMASSLAEEGAHAYTLVDARRAKVHLRLLEDRERLGRDLHDLIIQRIFAAGLRLQSAQGLIEDPVAAGRIAEAITQLDDIIVELRNTIFQLSTPVDLVVTDRLQTVVDEAARYLAVRPDLIITGDPSRIPDDVLGELEPALTEMLANVWRHASASRVEVTVQVGDQDVRVSVSDDGLGFDPDLVDRGSGLRNIELRAERLGGTFRVDSTVDRGTTVHWTVALEPTSSRSEVSP